MPPAENPAYVGTGTVCDNDHYRGKQKDKSYRHCEVVLVSTDVRYMISRTNVLNGNDCAS